MRYADIVQVKWNALIDLVRLQGIKENDLWKIQRPLKTLSKVEKQVKLKTNLLVESHDLFPNLKHITGCSLQFMIMCCEITDQKPKWYEKLLSRPDESPEYKSEFKIENLLTRIRNHAN